MRKNAIVRIVLYSLVVLVLGSVLMVGILVHSFASHSFFWGSSQIIDGNVASSGEVSASGIRELEVQWVAGSVTIQPGDTQTIQFSETPTHGSTMVWKQTGDKLVLQFAQKSWRLYFGFPIRRHSKDLVITVPRDWNPDEVKIDTVSADVNISQLNVREVDVNGVRANSNLERCKVEQLSVESVSGNTRFTGELNQLECKAVSGSCSAVLSNVPREIDISGVSGDLNLTLPENCGFNVRMDSLSGNFSSDFATSKSGRDYYFGDGRCQIEFNGLSGSVTVRKAVS